MAELIWVYGLAGTKANVFQAADNIEVEQRLQQSETLRFSLRADDPKVAYLVEDVELEYRGIHYRASRPEKVHDDKGPSLAVEAEAVWIELLSLVKIGVFALVGKTISDGLEAILDGTPWTAGTIETDGGSFSLEEADRTVLSLVREWGTLTGREVVFDTAAKTVSLVVAQGEDNGLAFRYAYNLRSIKRTATAPETTKLYAFGAADTTIATVNPTGKPYVEDFSWYTDQGVPLDVARELYTKEAVWVDDRYLNALNLYDAAVERLNALSQPQVSYEASVADLSGLTGWPEDAWRIGDVVRVFDSVLDLELAARVVRLVKRYLEPAAHELELAFLRPGVGDPSAVTSRDLLSGSSFKLLVDENAAPVTIGSSLAQLHNFALSFPGQGNVIVGLDIAAIASAAAGRIRISFWWGTTQVGPLALDVDFTASERVNLAVPISIVGLEGSNNFIVRAQIVSGTGTLTAAAAGERIYLLVDGALGGGVNTAPNVDINDDATPFLIDVTDSVTVVLV